MSEILLEEIRDLLVEIKGLLKSRATASINGDTAIDTSKQEQMSWEQYLEQKDPRSDYEIIALVVKQLTNDQKPSVTKEEILEFINKHPDRINNTETLSACIDKTKSVANYRYIQFVSANDKTYRLSLKGKQVVSQLPNRSKNTRKKKRSRK